MRQTQIKLTVDKQPFLFSILDHEWFLCTIRKSKLLTSYWLTISWILAGFGSTMGALKIPKVLVISRRGALGKHFSPWAHIFQVLKGQFISFQQVPGFLCLSFGYVSTQSLAVQTTEGLISVTRIYIFILSSPESTFSSKKK